MKPPYLPLTKRYVMIETAPTEALCEHLKFARREALCYRPRLGTTTPLFAWKRCRISGTAASVFAWITFPSLWIDAQRKACLVTAQLNKTLVREGVNEIRNPF